ncbi:SRPBCC domain-containing protein [Candidatus Uhrbacteria bacterium]|nr:SRPBCC domain-containing protein [Candidatus Uhrbacteria bacterium]
MATKTITIERIFDAPRERVWKAWTDPAELKKWWGPKDFTAPHIKTDLREGGKFLYCMRGPKGSEFDKDMWSGGIFKEIIPMEKIVATDHFADAEGNVMSPAEYGMPGDWGDMVVTATFEDAGPGKTKLTLVHTGHPADFADQANQGWNESLDKFAAIL